jgi:hypothetical protein
MPIKPQENGKDARSGLFRRLVATVSTLAIVGALVWWVLVPALGRRSLDSSRRRWAARGLPLERPAAVFRTTTTSTSAHEAAVLAGRLGLRLDPSSPARLRSGSPWNELLAAVIRSTSGWHREEPLPLLLPAEERTLGSAAPELRALAALLSENPPLTWDFDARSPETVDSLPFDYRQLVRVLLYDGLRRLEAGDPLQFRVELEAAWRLHEAAIARPDSSSSIAGMEIGRLVAAALRKSGEDSPLWRGRLADPEPRDLRLPIFFAAAEEDSDFRRLGAVRFVTDPSFSLPIGFRASLFVRDSIALARAPLAARILVSRLDWLAATSDRTEWEIPCDPAKVLAAEDAAPAEWLDERLAYLGPLRTELRNWKLDAEMTLLVLDAKALRRRTGAWPAKLPALGTDRCRGSRWSWTVDTAGHPKLTLSPAVVHGVGNYSFGVGPLEWPFDPPRSRP